MEAEVFEVLMEMEVEVYAAENVKGPSQNTILLHPPLLQ